MLNDTPSRDPLLREINRLVGIELDAKSEPKTNRSGVNWHRTLDLSQMTLVGWGRIVDASPYLNIYKVQQENGFTLWCSFMGATGFQTFGARQFNSLPLGSHVYTLHHPGSTYGTIIGVDPYVMTDPRSHMSDVVSQASRCGMMVDDCHSFFTNMAQRGGVANFGYGKPVDGLSAGEWGAMTETGLRVFLDSFMAQVSADETTGLFVFYHDLLTRLCGHNLQIRSCAEEYDAHDDENEINVIKGRAGYYHEMSGSFRDGATNTRSQDWQDVMFDEPEYSSIEPAHDDQQPFYRSTEFGGYLGQAGRTQGCLPPVNDTSLVLNRLSSDTLFPGVFEEQKLFTGAYSVRTAKQLILAKRPAIPHPKQVKLPFDLRGDTSENYKAAGLVGSGPDHVVTDAPVDGSFGAAPRELATASAYLDLAAYTFNWQNVLPFFYHTNDWLLPDESDGEISSNQLPPSFCALQGQQYLSAPSPVTVRVDHRYGDVTYYPNESYFAMLDNGGLVWGDGYGGEIKMVNGSIFISCPGDLWLQPGKNTNVWSGWDTSIRSLNSFDISATNKDGRVSASNNLMFLAGNNGCGGMLFESKATCPAYDFSTAGETAVCSGINFVARDSDIFGISKNQVWKLNADSPDGEMVFDAGIKKIRSYCDYYERVLGNAAIDFFSGCTSVNEWWGDTATVGGDIQVSGKVAVGGCLTVGGWVMVADGHIATSDAGRYGGVSTLAGSSLTEATVAVSNAVNRKDQLVGMCAVESVSYESSRMDGIQPGMEFSFRTTDQYRTDGFILFEGRWQQQARLGLGIPAQWTEVAASTQHGDTYPYPGAEAYTGTTLMTMDLNLYDAAGGVSVDRGAPGSSPYETPSYADVGSVILNGNYPVIRQV